MSGWSHVWAAAGHVLARVKAEPLLALRLDQFFLQSRDAMEPALLLLAWAVGVTGLLGAATDEYSWVDRIWSLAPWAYAWVFALHPRLGLEETDKAATDFGGLLPLPISRLTLMAALATLWGVRLTYNFWRKGGYAAGGEDYRWVEVKERYGQSPFVWQLFNFLFIAIFQNALLLAIVLPAYAAWVGRRVPLGPWDAAATGLFLLFLALETVADEQQWRFQQKKKAAMSTRPVRAAARRSSLGRGPQRAREDVPLLAGELADGFCQSGLFRYSRHPNFFAEQALWWSYHLFSYAATMGPQPPAYVHWTVVGPLVLSLLFQGSTKLTEEMSARKYPRYRQYQKTTSRLLPWLPKAHAH